MTRYFALTTRTDSDAAILVATFSHEEAANLARSRFRPNVERPLEVVEIQTPSAAALQLPHNVPLDMVQRKLATIGGMFWEERDAPPEEIPPEEELHPQVTPLSVVEE
jgi:hypothetical protein